MTATRRANVLSLSLTCALAACLAAFAARAQTPASRETPQAVAAPQSTPAPETSSTPEPGLTLLTVSVTDDYGRNVSGLGREHFTLYEGDTRQELLHFDAAQLTPAELQGLAQITGGRVFNVSSPAGITDAFRHVGLDLHNLYTLGFKAASADGKWRKLKVKVQPPPKWPHVSARTREGFYADAASGSNTVLHNSLRCGRTRQCHDASPSSRT